MMLPTGIHILLADAWAINMKLGTAGVLYADANPPPGTLPVEHLNGSDPFLALPQDAQRRYSAFDNSEFSLYVNGSPAQAKRALEAHLAETTRRLQETSQLGSALVQQRKELEDRLHEVEQQQEENDIGQDLRQKLTELEREFNEVGRETARVFLPKSRVPSGETDPAGGSVYSSEAFQSPTKVSVPSRKQKNQAPSRINDIALATEISTSLLSQLKELQAVLLEKDEALKAADLDRSQLEIEVEGLSHRLRTLDESESRLKDVNWSLETQIRESELQSKSAADKENRLNHALNLARTERTNLERELEELKQMYTKLNDDHINKVKQHETELASLRRNVAMTETEKGAMQRKVEELAAKNQQLAQAIAWRARSEERGRSEDSSPDDSFVERHSGTPEHSPAPSPSKATPRHGMLETETLKHSLQHAHRMIQQLKNNIHREKTEKIELKRVLQDTRDELDTARAQVAPGSASKRRKSEKDLFKKPPRPDRLGALRSGTQEIIEDDEWEEEEGMPSTPSRQPQLSMSTSRVFTSGNASAAETSGYEGFETANETSDAAFETANERDGMATESDAFQTGAETLDGDSSDQLTETEARPVKLSARRSRPSFTSRGRAASYESTASASGDDYSETDLRTPLQHQGSRLRLRPSSSRRSTPKIGAGLFASTPPASRDSPASYMSSSNENTPAQGKSLFAELNDLSDGDSSADGTVEGTPSRPSIIHSRQSSTDAFRRTITAPPRPLMVDSGMMTEPDIPEHITISSISTQATQPQAVRMPALQMSSLRSHDTNPQAPLRQDLQVSSISAHNTEPKQALPPRLDLSSVSASETSSRAPQMPQLAMSSLSAHGTEPQAPSVPLSTLSSLHSLDTTPRAVPVAPLDMSSVVAHTTEPRHASPQPLGLSGFSSQITEPRRSTPPPLVMSDLTSQGTEPRRSTSPSLGLSSFSSQGTEPVAPNVHEPINPSLDVSSISHQATEPKDVETPKMLAPTQLLRSTISTESIRPVEKTESTTDISKSVSTPEEAVSTRSLQMHQPQVLQISQVAAHATEPRDEVRKQAPLHMSALASHEIAPKDALQAPPPTLSTTLTQVIEPRVPSRERPQLSQLSSHVATAPVAPQPPRMQLSSFSVQSTDPVEMPKPAPQQLSSLSFQVSQPKEPLQPAPSSFSNLSSNATEPMAPKTPAFMDLSRVESQTTDPVQPAQDVPSQLSLVNAVQTEPFLPNVPLGSVLDVSDVQTVHDAQPESPTLPAFLPAPTSRPSTANKEGKPVMSFSSVATQNIEPLAPSRPVTAHRDITPLSISTITQTETVERNQQLVPKISYSDASPTTSRDASTITAPSSEEKRDTRVPLMPISANTPGKRSATQMTDGGTQTMVSAEQIDKLLLARSQLWSSTAAVAGSDKALPLPGSPTKQVPDPLRTPRRPGSSSSVRSRMDTPPPLPRDHKEVIAAASLRPMSPGSMGPPSLPASAYKKRPQTPTIKTSNNNLTPLTGGTTPRMRRPSQRSGASSPISRRSSLSSFTSEIDQRFNIPGGPSFAPGGLAAGATDPRMIQAITQTMIGEYLWKYTRKTGREDMSEKRHRRFFWIHPYTRTLYWSDRDPQSADKSTLKAKSVAIESVLEVDDPNPLPPGLHQKSLLVITPGRSMKFTATTGQRHETWFNALNYLCQRIEEGDEKTSPVSEQRPGTDEIQDEFNGGYRSSSRMTGRSRASVASYATRRPSSRDTTQVPTLRQSNYTQQRALSTEPPAHGSVTNRFTSMLRPSATNIRGSFSSRRSSKTSAPETPMYEEPSAAHMELSRDIHEHLERDEDFMPNVRACCDGQSLPFYVKYDIRANIYKGKHDVGHLHSHSVRGRHIKASSSRPSLFGSMSSRAQSRAESRAESRTESRTESRIESRTEMRNEQLRHQTEMEAANYSAGA
ncbi:hypothetical protein yc1106_04905 [Curvularia clavata]|uniref:PH domain-containing protein n=1 Tax=Curvularia clavata TaxID=95742 RepID=A0A9Q9DTP7_CURCL|nr:hypothetical protein yc1106_04905 [Curvularia clavata]